MFRPFSEGMRDLGYVEGRNVIDDHTFVDENYDRFQARAQESVDRKVDVILASVPAAASAARRVTTIIPIVFAASGDPVKGGLVESLRRPGGSLTGLSLFYPDPPRSTWRSFASLYPACRGWLFCPIQTTTTLRSRGRAGKGRRAVQAAGRGRQGQEPARVSRSIDAISAAKVDGMIVLGDATLRVNRKPIVDFAAASRLPTVYAPRDFVESGGLIAYGVSIAGNFRRSATYIDKIYKGARPSDLPESNRRGSV